MYIFVGQYNVVDKTRLVKHDRIGGVMVSILASSMVDLGFESRSGKTKDYIIGIFYFSAKHAALRSKSKRANTG